jgi:DNA relaxase NicK
MAEHSTVVLESQVDWLTCSGYSQTNRHELADLAVELSQPEIAAGNKLQRFELNGYKGFRSGRVRCGSRENATLLQLSGQVAEDNLALAAHFADHITRVDLAVTARTPILDETVGANAYQLASWHYEQHPNSALPWRVQDAATGETVYLGSRESDAFGRLYNKSAESLARGDSVNAEWYRNCWRYEVEYKGSLAASAVLLLNRAGHRAAHTQGTVFEYFSAHGVEPIFGHDDNRVLRPGFSRRSDYDTRLAWFQRSVAPAIAWCLDNGDQAKVLDALGLLKTPTSEQDK